MATRTASQDGPWNSSDTWGGAAPPGDADDAVIGAGRTVTVSADQTVGNSGANGTVAIALTGTLQVNAVLTLRGDISITQPGIVNVSRVGANTGGLTFDPASGTTYRIITVLGGSGTSQINFTGEAGDYVPVTTSLARSGNRAYFDFTDPPPSLNWDYVSFTDMGGTGDTTATRFLSYTGTSGSTVTLDYVRVGANVGKMNFDFSSLNNFTFDARNCDWRTSRNSDVLMVTADTALSSGTRQLKDCTFHAASLINIVLYARDFTIDGGVLSNTKIVGDAYDTANVVRNAMEFWNVAYGSGGFIAANVGSLTVEECGWLVDQANCDNPHYVVSAAAGLIVQDCVADGNGTTGSDDGDFLVPASGCTGSVVQRCLLINQTGALFSANTAEASAIVARRNTLAGASKGATVGETAGDAGAVARFSSNLCVGLPHGLLQDAEFVAQTGLNVDYNGCYNMSNASNFDIGANNGYLGPATYGAWHSGTYGSTDNYGLHDLYGDPQFVDDTRTVISWYNSVKGSGGSFTNARAEMLKLNGTAADGSAATFDSGMTLTALKTYLREGFTPQNAIYDGAGDPDDGSPTIGAVDFAEAENTLSVSLADPVIGGSTF